MIFYFFSSIIAEFLKLTNDFSYVSSENLDVFNIDLILILFSESWIITTSRSLETTFLTETRLNSY